MSEKKPVYHGYEERYLSGNELTRLFANKFLATGRHHSAVIALPIPDFLESKHINMEKTYRIFINEFFCRVMNGDTDKLITFFGYADLSDHSLYHRTEYVPLVKQCPQCNSTMNIKEGRFGLFLSCSCYPNCKGSKRIPIIATFE